MKFLKGLLTFIIGVILFFLIFSFSLVRRTKNFVEKDFIISTVRSTVTKELQGDSMNDEQKKLFEKLVNNKEAEIIVERIVQNYLDYKSDSVYELSTKDYNLIVDFVSKHLNEINAFSETKITMQNVKDELKYEDVSNYAKDTFKNFDEEVSSDTTDEVIEVYIKITSNNTILKFYGAMFVCILLICLINWSVIKWTIVTGIDLIISGGLVLFIYVTGLVLKNGITGNEDFISFVKNININGFLYLGVAEIIFGILLIVFYGKMKKEKQK